MPPGRGRTGRTARWEWRHARPRSCGGPRCGRWSPPPPAIRPAARGSSPKGRRRLRAGILAAVDPLRVLLFDVFGTLVGWRSSLIDIAESIAARGDVQAGWAAIVDDWRRAYQPALDEVRRGATWRDLDSLQRETLSDVLARHGVPLPAARQESLVRGWP